MADPSLGFGPAAPGEEIVFGARRPGYPEKRVSKDEVGRWISFMQGAGVGRVVCLLSAGQLGSYDDLIGDYEKAFGPGHVLWSPIEDYHLADVDALTGSILPFISASAAEGRRVVVHCAGGIGRTGHVLAAWLVASRGMSNQDAVETVRRSGRNASESGDPALDLLLNAARAAFRDVGGRTERGGEDV